MGIEALTHREDGTRVDVPRSREDWQQWVSPGRTRNWMLNDPLLDWLDWHGKDKGYIPAQSGPDYRAELDFLPFIFEQGRKFEEGILRLLHAQHEVTVIAQDPHDIRDLAKAEETFAAMRSGDPIIHQAVLWDAEHMTYGAPDFLIRSDVLLELFPPACSDERRKLFPTDIISEDEARIPAPALGDVQWHYRVVDVKFTTLHLNAGANQLDNGGSNPAYKAQLYLYNRMLGRLQGHQPPNSYLLGRGWEFERKNVDHRGSNALDRLGHISQDGAVARGISIKDKVEEALAWIRRMRTEGHSWSLTDVPLRSELYPNMSASGDDMLVDRNRPEADRDAGEVAQDWGSVKKWLAEQIKELTQLWQVSVDGRKQAHGKGIYGWDDPRISPEDVLTRGVNGYGPRLARMLRVNAADGPQILPECVEQDRDVWHPTPSLEFYVDFEFCMDLNDDFSRLPERGGQTLIFMIGCGHVEDGDWKFEKWITDRLTEDEELRIIRGWVDHMREVQARLDPINPRPRIFHWAHAEKTQLENSYNSARKRRNGEQADWPSDLNFYDFLSKVMNQEPVVLKGAWGFGLKAVANAMHKHGMIDTNWADSPVDGLGAMVGAWHCDAAAREKGTSMADEPLMHEIAQYNEVDCKAMMDIVRHLRENH